MRNESIRKAMREISTDNPSWSFGYHFTDDGKIEIRGSFVQSFAELVPVDSSEADLISAFERLSEKMRKASNEDR